MRRLLTLLSICLGLPAVLCAQTQIDGVITDQKTGKPAPNLNVTIQEKNSPAILAFATTNNKGEYKLSFSSRSDSLLLTVSGLNVGKTTLVCANKKQTIDLTVSNREIELKEVKVTLPRIRLLGDTLNYLVEGFTDPSDRTIGDVLKKMPGIEVKENGAINYNNRPINKFYIENADLLQGRYGIATNNIEAKDVSTVQVLENHQPIKALKDRVFSEEAAINLKLKDASKGKIVGNLQMGGGTSFPEKRWSNELFGMYFAKGKQHMASYKGNNTGDNVSRDLASFYSGAGSAGDGDGMLNVQMPASPAIAQSRYLFNRAHIVSLNNLWTLGNDYQLNANINYQNDRQERNSFARTTYYLPGDSLLAIEEQLSSRMKVNQVEGEVLLNSNKKNFYLDNELKFKGSWRDYAGYVRGENRIDQELDRSAYRIENNFRLLTTKGKATWNFTSNTNLGRTPEHLLIFPLTDTEDRAALRKQSVAIRHFTTSNSVSFGLKQGILQQYYTAGVKADLQHLGSRLQPEIQPGAAGADSLQNDLQWNRYSFYLSPAYTLKIKNLNATLTPMVAYEQLYIGGQETGKTSRPGKVFFQPSFSLVYRPDLFWNLGGIFPSRIIWDKWRAVTPNISCFLTGIW